MHRHDWQLLHWAAAAGFVLLFCHGGAAMSQRNHAISVSIFVDRFFLMNALPLMLDEAQFSAEFMELYQLPEQPSKPAAVSTPSTKVGMFHVASCW